jgi:hypothetical protein
MPTITSREQRRRRWAIYASLALVGLTAAACNSSPSEGALAGKSPTKIISLSITALHHQRSFHFVTKTVQGSHTQTQIGDVATDAAAQSIQSGKSPIIEAVLSRGDVYVRANKQLLQTALRLPADAADQHAGDWLLVKKGDAVYPTISSSLTPTSAIELFVPEQPGLKVAGVTTLAGHNVVAVQGSPGASAPSGDTAVVTLFVSTTAPYLPVGATLVVSSANHKTIERLAALYGKWNEPVHPSVPKSAVPVSSLSGV